MATTNGSTTNGSSDDPSPSNPIPLWVAGEEVTTDTTFDVYAPSDSSKLWSSSSASTKEAIQAVEAAHTAFSTWRHTKPAEIRRILLKAADIVDARREELGRYVMQETGVLAGFNEWNVVSTIENLRDAAGRASNILGAIPQTGTPGQAAFLFKEPYGVIFGIVPGTRPTS